MARFTRVPFELLPPEQQEEALEKQQRYKQQRDMLLDQIEERKISKYEKSEAEDDYDDPTMKAKPPRMPAQIASQQNEALLQQNPDYNPIFNVPLLQTQNIVLPPQKPLLQDRARPVRSQFVVPTNLSTSKIHDIFANLRHQIRSNAATTVINTGSYPQSARKPANQWNDSPMVFN